MVPDYVNYPSVGRSKALLVSGGSDVSWFVDVPSIKEFETDQVSDVAVSRQAICESQRGVLAAQAHVGLQLADRILSKFSREPQEKLQN